MQYITAKTIVLPQRGYVYPGCRQAFLATLYADKLETVVRRRGSETNCIRNLPGGSWPRLCKIYNHNRAILTTKHL